MPSRIAKSRKSCYSSAFDQPSLSRNSEVTHVPLFHLHLLLDRHGVSRPAGIPFKQWRSHCQGLAIDCELLDTCASARRFMGFSHVRPNHAHIELHFPKSMGLDLLEYKRSVDRPTDSHHHRNRNLSVPNDKATKPLTASVRRAHSAFAGAVLLFPLLYFLHMIPGILLLLLGLSVFIAAGIKLDDAPGVEKKTVIIMMVGIAFIVLGGILLYGNAFGA